jgi:hypothetical protein
MRLVEVIGSIYANPDLLNSLASPNRATMPSMKKTEAQQALDPLIYKWANATNQPMPPDGTHHYSFSQFWTWLENNHWPYTQFRAVPNARYVMEMCFDRRMRQAWRD